MTSVHLSRRASVAAGLRLSVLSLSLGAALAAQAQSGDVTLLALADPNAPQVVTVASRLPVADDHRAADVVVIDRDRIAESPAASLADLLQAEAGVQLSRNGDAGHSTSVLLRGAGGGNTLLLIDGVRIGSATLGQADFAGLGLAQIERIEVLRGPASSLYGADAVGGVVLVTTRRGDGEARLEAQVAAGGYGSRTASAALSGSRGALDYALSFSREASDGVSTIRPGDRFGNYNPDRDGYQRRASHARFGFSPASGQRVGLTLLESRLDSRYDASEYLPPSYAQDASADFRSLAVTRLAAVDYEGRLSPDWTLRAQLARNLDDSTGGGVERYRITTWRDAAMLQADWRMAAGHDLALSVDASRERARATSFLADVARTNQALTLAYVGDFKPVTVQADLRHDDNSAYGGSITGRLGARWALAPGLSARALVGKTFHAPGFNDLYYPGYGVASIQPEQGRSAELGLSWQQGGQSLSATLWRNRISDMIAYEPDKTLCPIDPGYSYGCARNYGQARLSGLTLAGENRGAALTLRGGYDYLEAHDGLTGQWLPRRARHQVHAAADYRWADWRLGAALLYLSDRPDGTVVLRGHSTVDLSATWQMAPRWQLQAKLMNALNTDFEPLRDYQSTRRQGWLGLRYEGGLL